MMGNIRYEPYLLNLDKRVRDFSPSCWGHFQLFLKTLVGTEWLGISEFQKTRKVYIDIYSTSTRARIPQIIWPSVCLTLSLYTWIYLYEFQIRLRNELVRPGCPVRPFMSGVLWKNLLILNLKFRFQMHEKEVLRVELSRNRINQC